MWSPSDDDCASFRHLSLEHRERKPGSSAEVRGLLDSRYDDLKSGRIKPIDGEEAFARMREKSKRRRDGST